MRNLNLTIMTLVFVVASLSSNSFALTFKVGSAAGVTVTEDELMQALRAGQGSVKGVKIVVKPGANVPQNMKQKWMANQLSGADAPTEGAENDKVIFVEGF